MPAPFVLWAVQGVRSRSVGWAAVGIAGMLACRQEFAVMVATFAFLPPREPESLSLTLRWRRTLFLIGLLWLVVGFFGYLRFTAGPGPSDAFIDQFLGPKAAVPRVAGDFARDLAIGHGGLGASGLPGAPRRDSCTLPWIWGPCSGQWAMRMLSTSEWHAVRYVMPMAAIVLAAG